MRTELVGLFQHRQQQNKVGNKAGGHTVEQMMSQQKSLHSSSKAAGTGFPCSDNFRPISQGDHKSLMNLLG